MGRSDFEMAFLWELVALAMPMIPRLTAPGWMGSFCLSQAIIVLASWVVSELKKIYWFYSRVS